MCSLNSDVHSFIYFFVVIFPRRMITNDVSKLNSENSNCQVEQYFHYIFAFVSSLFLFL